MFGLCVLLSQSPEQLLAKSVSAKKQISSILMFLYAYKNHLVRVRKEIRVWLKIVVLVATITDGNCPTSFENLPLLVAT